MAKLYYGDGNCSIVGPDIVGAELRFKGAIEIEDKTNDSFAIAYQNNAIMVFPNVQNFTEGDSLSNLFDYKGELKITSILVANKNADKVSTTIHKVMDYSELLGNSEDITTKSEDLNQGNISGKAVNKTLLNHQFLENLDTSKGDYDLFLEDGSAYDGKFKINLLNNQAITEDGKPLFFKNGVPTKNEKSAPIAAKRLGKKKRQLKRQVLKNIRTPKRANISSLKIQEY